MIFRTIVFSAICLLSSKAIGAVPTLPCSGCSSIQKERVAETVGRFGTIKHVVIMDYDNNLATKYSVEITMDRQGEPLTNIYETGQTNDEMHDASVIFEVRSEIMNMISNAQELPVFNFDGDPIENSVNGTLGKFKPSTYQKTTDNGAHLSTGELIVRGDPYKFMSTSQIRNSMFDYYENGSKGTIDGLISSVLKKLEVPFVSDMDISIKLNFVKVVDGVAKKNGMAIIEPDFTLETFDVLKTEDKDGNTLPPKKADLTEEQFIFKSPETRDAFLGFYFGLPSTSTISCTLVSSSTGGDTHTFTYKCG
ncbi:hypothetical protein [Paraglaciecola marina]|uniref:hypothetical protein n=1 Tax=Paraglaciecola marina TaxID=2500157 RepID=UPI00105BF865|nr:hypothetical protein [Paraglaciecola marina]